MMNEANSINSRKKILFLGGFPQMVDIVKKAKDMGNGSIGHMMIQR